MCVPAVRADMLKIEGVDSVAFSVDLRQVVVHLKPGNKVTIKHIRQFLGDEGFFTRGADVQLAGKLTRQGRKTALNVTGTDVLYLLEDHPDAKGKVAELEEAAMGKEVVIVGHLPREWGKEPVELSVLRLRSFSPVKNE